MKYFDCWTHQLVYIKHIDFNSRKGAPIVIITNKNLPQTLHIFVLEIYKKLINGRKEEKKQRKKQSPGSREQNLIPHILENHGSSYSIHKGQSTMPWIKLSMAIDYGCNMVVPIPTCIITCGPSIECFMKWLFNPLRKALPLTKINWQPKPKNKNKKCKPFQSYMVDKKKPYPLCKGKIYKKKQKK